MFFDDFELDPRLRENLRAMGFEVPTPIQSATIPAALAGRDILGSAETGTGKTAAYLLPLLQKLISTPGGGQPRVLVVVPTRELALQVAEHAAQLGRGLPVRVVTIYGGVGYGPQDQALQKGVDIVIATPGRLLDQIARRRVSFGALEALVLDEGDRMLDIGFLPDIRRIMRYLPRERQTMLFSATLDAIGDLAREVTDEPVRVQVEQTVTPDAITQAVYPVPEHMKFDMLQKLLADEEMDSVLIFTRTKHRADRLVRNLQRAKINATVIHGDRSQGQRVAALEAFRRGNARVLVATDIAARGIDVQGISHVVNYDVPMQPEDYVHRIGRTGRASAVGHAYTFATPADTLLVRRIEEILQEKLERREVEGIDYAAATARRLPTLEEIQRYVEANRRKSGAETGSGPREQSMSRGSQSHAERVRV